MPTIKPKRATVKEVYQGFAGIGYSSDPKKLGCQELQNFRILSDGTLEKRCGFTKLYDLPGIIRAFWGGLVDGKKACFAVVGNTVYQELGDFFVQGSTISSSTGKAEFVLYHDTLYLLDGISIYVYRPVSQRFEPAIGYVPLIGLAWNPSVLGEGYESPNLFSDKVRISYKNTDGSLTYSLPFFAASIDYVQADGQSVTDFVLNPDEISFSVPHVYSWLEVGFTIKQDYETVNRIKSARRVFCDRVNDTERLFLYGCSSGNDLFGTARVDESMMNSCLALYPNADPLYLPSDMWLSIGSADDPITTLYKNHERLLAFHAKGAVSIQIGKDSDTATYYPLLYGYGCTAKLPSVALKDKLVIVNRGGIFLLSSDAGNPDDFELSTISDGINELKAESFIQNATVCYDAGHEELWFYDQKNALTIWVYHLRKKVWYTFTGISPDICLIHEGCVAFVRNSVVYVFDDSATTDSGREIHAKMKSNLLFSENPETVKRSLRVTLLASSESDPLTLSLNSEKQTKTLQVSSGGGKFPFLLDGRADLGRFRVLQAELSTSGKSRPRIYRLALFANS